MAKKNNEINASTKAYRSLFNVHIATLGLLAIIMLILSIPVYIITKSIVLFVITGLLLIAFAISFGWYRLQGDFLSKIKK